VSLQLENAGIAMDGRWLVRNVSVTVAPGRVTALVGPNGSGKSTVLRLLAGLWRPTEGRAAFDSEDLAALPRRTLARRVTFVPQDTHIDFAFTVRDIVAMGRHAHLGRFESPRTEDAAAVETALEQADVADLAERFVNELSGGERQRVLIARSLSTEAEVILLDEPTSNLDVDHSLETLSLLRQLAAGGKTVVVALHDLNAVSRWADDAALLSEGSLRAYGAVTEVLREDHVEAVFGVRIERLYSAQGEPVLVFHQRVGRPLDPIRG
jgi:iron complex transport system ATP-binding protein